MHLFSFLILFHALSLTLSHDVGIEAVLSLSDKFMKNFGMGKGEKQNIFIRSKGKLPKKFSRATIMRATWVGNNKTNELIEYVDHVKQRGVSSLQASANLIISDLGIVKDIIKLTQYVNALTKNYETTMQNYLEYVIGQKAKFVIEEEFTFLDMVETACRLLYSQQKQILDFAGEVAKTDPNNTNTNFDDQIKTLNQIIYRQSINTKKEEMRHICHKHEVCRPYPAFTDYFADFLAQIIKLPEDSLPTLFQLIKSLVDMNADFFNIIPDEKDRKFVVKRLVNGFDEFNATKAAMIELKSILVHRFKIMNTTDLKWKLKTQAVRILLDIIDKAYQYEQYNLMFVEFDQTVQALRSWISEDKFFPEAAITHLFHSIMTVLELNLSKNGKEEMGVLIETILWGSSKNEKLFKTLFRDGSAFVKGLEFAPNLEVL
ncbi:uncharacterized protein LOC142982233 [Anticarsia gemmatalis]|uniref:uncharacterized protein LOC142982233 n=1 Tax=Anticarsia gemmatalis TaxID=129554 RepID=UPI003F775BE4